MYCRKCGARISDSAKFCIKCGSAVVRNTVQSAEGDTEGNVPVQEPVIPQENQTEDLDV